MDMEFYFTAPPLASGECLLGDKRGEKITFSGDKEKFRVFYSL